MNFAEYLKYYVSITGVLQGSVLGPLLFVLFINDIGNIFKHRLFVPLADDLEIYNVIDHHSNFLDIQSNFNQLQEWCILNHLSLNPKKCSIISYSKHVYLLSIPIL